MNIVDPILYQCKLNPYATAICVAGQGTVTYGQLERLIGNVIRNALNSGIAPGSLVSLYVTDVILHIALTLGLMRLGAATLSLREPKDVPGIKPDVVLTDMPGRVALENTILTVDDTWVDGDGALPTKVHQLHGSDDDTCRIILTSGSTGLSKGVAFSHRSLAARVSHNTYSKGPRFAHCSRFFCDLSITTSPGIQFALSLLSRGGTVYFLGPDPADILQTMDLHKIQGMATSPYGLGEFLGYFEADSAFEVNFDHIICQGAMLSPELAQRARSRMCQNLYSSYGSTETTTVAFGPASVLQGMPGAVGYILPGATIESVDGSGRVLPPLQDGSLRIRSHYMAEGYVGDPETTQAMFRDGYFYSGDVGHTTPDNILVITGREKTALNIGGDTVSPELVEQVISSFPGVKEAGVFAANNELGIAEIVALIVTSQSADHAALQNFCAARLPRYGVPVQFIGVDALPRGGQGKLERHRLPELAAAKTKAV